MSATEIVIASAKRTAVGSFNGAFANTPAHELGAVAIKAALGVGESGARGGRRGHPRADTAGAGKARIRPGRRR